ncbi:thioredoxin family protein [Peptostreptococcaceae bacterium OttesenSCG-928-C18]|nr:thioredoxin family protein [Peptostreptococcaceae bacterium OttesenSCG-928-C18]
MVLFGKKKKTESCCCGDCDTTDSVKGADVKILGTGCSKCVELGENAKKALEELGMNTDIEKVTELTDIATYGVMSTPALVYKNKVLSYGKVLTVEEIKNVLNK